MYSRLASRNRSHEGGLLVVGLDDPDPRDVLLNQGCQHRELFLDLFESLVDFAPEELDAVGDQQEGAQGQKSQAGVGSNQYGDGQQDHEQGVDRVHDARPQHHSNGAQVVGGPRHHVARGMPLVERGCQPLQVPEEVVAQVEFDPAGDADEDPPHQVSEEALGTAQGQQQSSVAEQEAGVGSLGEIIDRPSQDLGRDDHRHVGHEDHRDTGGDAGAVLPQVGDQGGQGPRSTGSGWVSPHFSPGRYDVKKKNLLLNICANIPKVPLRQTVLGARSLVFSPSARTCSLKRSHHYALGREHALRAKILRDRHAPW